MKPSKKVIFEQNRLGKRLKLCDRIVLFSVFFMILTRIATFGYISHVSKISKASIDNVVKILEANPVAGWILNLQNMAMIIQFIAIPALVVTLYIFLRRKVVSGKIEVMILEFLSILVLLAMFLNAINDWTIFLGVVI